MSNLMEHRWYELRYNGIFWLTLTICFAFALCLIGIGGYGYITQNLEVPGVTRDWLGLFRNSAADCILPLLIISSTFTALILGQQYSNRTVDQEIAAGHSRAELFASQCVIGFAVPNLTVLPAILVACLCWAGRVPMPSAAEAFPYLARVLVLLLLLDFSLFSACMIFVVLFRDTTKTMAVSALFLTVACFTMPALEQSLAKAPGTAYPVTPSLPLLLDPAFLLRYSLYPGLTLSQCIWTAGVALGWTALFLSLAYCIFRRCELK